MMYQSRLNWGQSIVLSVSGSRTFTDYAIFERYMDQWCECNGTPTQIVHGDALGTDKMADRYADEHAIEAVIYKPDWNRYGRAAGIIRNGTIVDRGTHLLAFCVNDSRGTMNAVTRSIAAGKPTVVIHNPSSIADTRVMIYNGGKIV